METARSLISDSVFKNLEFYTSLVRENGEDSEYLGVKLLDEPEKFVKGALINCAVKLFLHYNAKADNRDAKAWERVVYFIRMLKDDHLKTWGKLNALRGTYALYETGFLATLPEDCIQILREKTRYDDFYDTKRKMLLGNYPSNYYQVALGCAGIREAIGWDEPGECDIILEKLFSVMSDFSDSGWMDERPPYGRFDRYSMMVAAELTDTLDFLKKPIPEFALKALKSSAELALACANPHGDGVLYGRSLSVHGDCAYLEILATALRHGLVSDEDIRTAVLYCGSILRHTFSYWYDTARRSYDLWFDGRTTNSYRQVHRLLEVNLDMSLHMLNTLDVLEAADCADEPLEDPLPRNPHSFSRPQKTVFRSVPNDERVLYSFVRKGTLYQLPLIGGGEYALNAAYLPFPTSPSLLEAPPETRIPFLVPHFVTERGDKLLPSGFYTEITDKKISKLGMTGIEITAKGMMSLFSMEHPMPEKSDRPFTATYTFVDDTVRIVYEADTDEPLTCRCTYACKENGCAVSFNGNVPQPTDVSGASEYHTPHGACTKAYEYSEDTNKLTVMIRLPK